ncbi:hypothetical protein SAMN02982989_3992 [Xaviernesmea oryzae]|uniref:SpoVT-AbrB domain-containing protein n=1 Tax=Xaviernesmea oryzae TaxID=464029 RepID=A0A1X7GMB9_9HYPH|nr:AbrB/MazE/SpoVT family DNA-binding domain-containing protein [Xaviernesmea oryzae]SMF71219.1 hypothetical protein SAMN02982989_3992 [Xaviernesmea oryzae]
MARAKMKDGAIVIPQSVRNAHGLVDGSEFEVIDGGEEIRLRLVGQHQAADPSRRKLTVQEFLDGIPEYDGPPVDLSTEAIREAIDRAAIEDWERLERQWNEDKDR